MTLFPVGRPGHFFPNSETFFGPKCVQTVTMPCGQVHSTSHNSVKSQPNSTIEIQLNIDYPTTSGQTTIRRCSEKANVLDKKKLSLTHFQWLLLAARPFYFLSGIHRSFFAMRHAMRRDLRRTRAMRTREIPFTEEVSDATTSCWFGYVTMIFAWFDTTCTNL